MCRCCVCRLHFKIGGTHYIYVLFDRIRVQNCAYIVSVCIYLHTLIERIRMHNNYCTLIARTYYSDVGRSMTAVSLTWVAIYPLLI